MKASPTNRTDYAVDIPQVVPKQGFNIHDGVHGVGKCVSPACIVELSPTAQILLKQLILLGG